MNYPAPLPPTYTLEEPRPREIDLRGLRMVILRRFRLLITVFAVVGGGTFCVTLLQPRLYTATASILISPTREQVVAPEQSIQPATPNAAFVDSEIEVLRSARLARRVVETLKLETDPDWNPALRASALADPSASGQDETESVARALANATTVSRRGLSHVIDISVEARNPDGAARVANQIVDAYLDVAHETRLEGGERASGWLAQRLSELRQDVQEKEAAAEAYRTQSGLLSAEGHPLTESQISEVQSAMLSARAELAASEARHRQVQAVLQSGGQGDTMNDVLTSDVIRDLRRQEAELTRQQAERESTLGPRHPFVVQGQAELADVRGQIVSEIGRIGEQISNEVEVARTRLATLQRDLNGVRAQLVSDNDAQVRLRELEREAAGARQVYENFLQRYHEVAGQGQLSTSPASIVSQAFPPQTASSPRLLLGGAAAVLAGLIGALLAGFAAHAFNNAIVSADDIEPHVGVPALASIPALHRRALRLLAPTDRHPPGYLVEKPHSQLAEAFRVLRAVLLQSNREGPKKVVAITSALPGEGKTSCALGLARIAAMSGQSVLLVDGDLRRRSLNDFLDITPRAGLVQVLLGERSWRDVVGVDEPSGAHVLPLAASGSTSRDVFNTPAMQALIEEVRDNYDLVVLDAAPVLITADARSLAAHADAAIVVARWGKTNIRATASAVMQLHRAGVHVAGVALNRVDPRIPGWGSYADSLYYNRADYTYETV